MVERSAHADGEGDDCGGKTKGNLCIDIGSILVRTGLPFPSTNGRKYRAIGRRARESATYQIRKTIQFLSHHTALLPPARNLAIHEIEEQAKGQESQGGVHVSERGGIAEAVAQGGEDGHDPAEAYNLRAEKSQPRCPRG